MISILDKFSASISNQYLYALAIIRFLITHMSRTIYHFWLQLGYQMYKPEINGSLLILLPSAFLPFLQFHFAMSYLTSLLLQLCSKFVKPNVMMI